MNQSVVVDPSASGNATATPLALLLSSSSSSPPPPSTPLPCDVAFFSSPDCLPEVLINEERFLAIMSVMLACAVCALIVLVMVMAALIHKLSVVWIKSLTRPAQTEPSDDPRKGLLQETKSSLRSATPTKAEGKKKKTSFSEDTSCAPARDVDEEDL
jgi:hypothetical protein